MELDDVGDQGRSDMAVVIEWPDGTVDEGPNPMAVLEQIAATQWTPCTVAKMREELSDRAWKLGQDAIDPQLPLDEFFGQLAEVGCLTVLEFEPEIEEPAASRPATTSRLTARQRRARDELALGFD
jgi:hypothetical protein